MVAVADSAASAFHADDEAAGFDQYRREDSEFSVPLVRVLNGAIEAFDNALAFIRAHVVSPVVWRALDPLKDMQPALGSSAASPSCGNKAEARISAPDHLRTNVGVMPLTRPDVISDCVSLSDKLGRSRGALVPEYRAVDALLTAGIDELSPNKKRVCSIGSEDNFLARASKQNSSPAVSVSICGVVPLVEFEAGHVAVFGEIPERFNRLPP